MHRTEITDDQIERLRALADDEPVVMVNLLTYRALAADGDGPGRDAYERYSGGVIQLLKARQGYGCKADMSLSVAKILDNEFKGCRGECQIKSHPAP